MTILRRLIGGLSICVLLLAAATAQGAATTDYSDQWWIEKESGWGASVLQQEQVLFIDLFVYGADGKPTWFTAAAAYQGSSPAGHDVFTGELYLTAGSYYGAAWSPEALVYRKVGTLTFDATAGNAATLAYTVDGTPVVKAVTRQFWRYEDLSGSYYGGIVWDQTCGAAGARSDRYEFLGSLGVTHSADNTIRVDQQITTVTKNGVAQSPLPSNTTLLVSGLYAQSGHMGRIQGKLSFTIGSESGTIAAELFEIERTSNGMTGLFAGTAAGGGACTYGGRFGGVRR